MKPTDIEMTHEVDIPAFIADLRKLAGRVKPLTTTEADELHTAVSNDEMAELGEGMYLGMRGMTALIGKVFEIHGVSL